MIITSKGIIVVIILKIQNLMFDFLKRDRESDENNDSVSKSGTRKTKHKMKRDNIFFYI